MQQLNKCMRELCAVLITVWMFLTLPVTVLLLLPFYVWRRVVSTLSRLLRSDLTEMITGVSALLATDSIYTSPRINIGINLKSDVLAGKAKLSKDEIVQLFSTQWIKSRDADGQFLFPHFQQYVTTWMGFSFWKWESKFKIENHVYTIENTTLTADEYLNRPFTEGQSPWELIVFETPAFGSFTGTTVHQVTIRYHHVLADGYSIFEAINHLAQANQQFYKPKPKHIGKCEAILVFLKRIAFPVLGIYELVKGEMEPMEKCILNPPNGIQTEFAISAGVMSDKLPLSTIQEIKNKFQVSSTTTLFAAVAGGIRKFLLDIGYDLPKHIKTSMPVLTPSRKSDKLINQFSSIVVNLPIGEEDVVKRIQLIEATFQKSKRSTVPIVTYFMMNLLSELPIALVRKAMERPWPPYLISAIVGPKEAGYFRTADLEVEIQEINYTMACHKYGVLFNICSYENSLQLSVCANKAVLSSNAAVQKLQDRIMEEFEILRGLEFSKTGPEKGGDETRCIETA